MAVSDMGGMQRFAEYYRLAKPGIVYGNALSAIAAFLYATNWQVWRLEGWVSAALLFFAMLLGISLVIASACVFNNYFDRDIDKWMERTRTRPLVTGSISLQSALLYGAALGLSGLALLAFFANLLTAGIALLGWVTYVFVYGWAKRRGWWGVLVGTIPGALPIVVGYTAVTDRLTLPALLLFLTMVVWQIPHFYGIALFRREEYAAAGIPTLVNVKGVRAAKMQSVIFIGTFSFIAPLLFVLDFAGYTYGISMLVIGLAWLWRAVRSDTDKSDAQWGRDIFFFSLVVLLWFCIALAVSPLLP